ncbi:MAG: hypothetical protein ACYC9J_10995 [Sulfuricaulis sp.]
MMDLANNEMMTEIKRRSAPEQIACQIPGIQYPAAGKKATTAVTTAQMQNPQTPTGPDTIAEVCRIQELVPQPTILARMSAGDTRFCLNQGKPLTGFTRGRVSGGGISFGRFSAHQPVPFPGCTAGFDVSSRAVELVLFSIRCRSCSIYLSIH